jgi:hypothetical protein
MGQVALQSVLNEFSLEKVAMVVLDSPSLSFIILIKKGQIDRIATKACHSRDSRFNYKKLYHHEDGENEFNSAMERVTPFLARAEIRTVSEGDDDLYWSQYNHIIDGVTSKVKIIRHKDAYVGEGCLVIDIKWVPDKYFASLEVTAKIEVS